MILTETGQMQFPAFTAHCCEGVLEIKFAVDRCHTDPFGRMPPQAVAQVMEAAVKQQMEGCGWGRETVEQKNLVWVVGWTSIQIKRLPHLGETLLVRIWPGRKKHSMHVRKFAFFTDAGEPLVSAAVLFLMMDRKTRKLALSAAEPVLMEVVIPGEADIPKLHEVFPSELPHKRTRIVASHEIDENGHMNNACYLEWAGALCEEQYLAQHEPRSIWVQYIKELTEGLTVTLEYVMKKQKLFVHGTANGGDIFLAVIQYKYCGNLTDGRDRTQ